MVYVAQKEKFEDINFLKSEKFVSFTQQVDDTHAQEVDGVVPAGALYPANDATAIGVTINDVDVSKGAQPVGVITEGHILAERLPEAPAAEAIEALGQINFYDGNGGIYVVEQGGE
jgi:deoxyribose-phosphate aldolase